MSKFDYKHTCPDIDKSINSAYSSIEDSIADFIQEHLVSLTDDVKTEMRDDFTTRLFSQIESAFEEVRKCNSDMRDEADRQISALAEDLSDSEEAEEDLRKECVRLEDIIRDLQSEIEDLKQEVKDLNTQLEDVS